MIQDMYRSGAFAHYNAPKDRRRLAQLYSQKEVLETQIREKCGEVFSDYSKCMAEIHFLENLDEFLDGVRFGGQVMLEVFREE